jgi:probable phosphoglycerate mutase
MTGRPRLPDLSFTVTFDGGSLGNPGVGYGSYAIATLGRQPLIKRLQFSQNSEIVTNNQAEYRTLVAALEELIEQLGADAGSATVTIQGDSKLVIEQVAGRWKVKSLELKPLCARVRELVSVFGKVDFVWHPRSRSVETLGH